VEVRRYWTTSALQTLRTKDQWHGLQTVGLVESERSLNGETTLEQRYYILSLPNDARTFGTSVRAHWGIENVVVSSSLRHVHFPNESFGARSHPEARHATCETV